MTSTATANTAKFDRMTKEEKLRFCQDLIKQAANLTKSAAVSGAHSTGSKTNVSGAHTKSKSSKRPASAGGASSKKNKSGALTSGAASKSHGKSGTAKRSTSKSSVKSSASHQVRLSRPMISHRSSIVLLN